MIIRILSQNLTNKNLMRETIIEEKKVQYFSNNLTIMTTSVFDSDCRKHF